MPALPALTSLRFLAALAVFLHHAGLFADGFFGVTFFFVLSGFILTYNYRRTLADGGRGAVWDFYVARFARVYPLHIFALIAALPWVASQMPTVWHPLKLLSQL